MQKILLYIKNKLTKIPIKTPLGRWNIPLCNNIIDRKIDMANMDNCGPCGKYKIDNIVKKIL
jgi:hypothetical protein